MFDWCPLERSKKDQKEEVWTFPNTRLQIKTEAIDSMTENQGLESEENKTKGLPSDFTALLDFLRQKENKAGKTLQSFAPSNNILLRKKVHCFACGYETLRKTEDRVYHHRKHHLRAYLKHIEPQGTDESKDIQAECILRYIIAFAEKLWEEGYKVQSFDYKKTVYRDHWEQKIKSDMDNKWVVYFCNVPPFFNFTYDDLLLRVTSKLPEYDWGFLRSYPKVTYPGKIAYAHGKYESMKLILKHASKDLIYKEKKPLCKHGNRLNDCVLVACLKKKGKTYYY